MGKRSTTEEFIAKSKLIHGDRYRYQNVHYINNSTKVNIECTIHGTFSQAPGPHLSQKQGCPICAGTKQSTTLEFIEKSKLIHGTRYNYDKVEYVRAHDNVIIICAIHGDFLRAPTDHLHGCGCNKCGGSYSPTIEEFIEKAQLIHSNKYSYTRAMYVNAHTNIIIICPTHGEYVKSPSNHIQGAGCPVCSIPGTRSDVSIEWLELIMQQDNIFIQHADNVGEYIIESTRYRADGYCKETNTIYEFYGDFYHGNPNIHTPNTYNKLMKQTMGELLQKTIDREQKIRDLGYNLVVTWESDYRKQKLDIKQQSTYN